MSYSSISPRGAGFKTLRQLARPAPKGEQCSLCGVGLSLEHRHLLETASGKIRCACDPCALRFQDVVGGRFKLIPRDVRALPDFQIADADWERLALPINLAFFFHSTAKGGLRAIYPSPAGPMESLLPFEGWSALAAEHAILPEIDSDVEALLVNRIGTSHQHFIAPIDTCYELVGLIRTHWRGLSGGEKVWQETEQFFARLSARAECPASFQEVSHA